MSTQKRITITGWIAVAVCVLLTILFLGAKALATQEKDTGMGYENRLFAADKVHTIDIVLEDWEGFLTTCPEEEYVKCHVQIDGELYTDVGIRGKGNTSLRTVSSMDSDRYSFKVEFDRYDEAKSYYGLDKLCLNNLIQDNTYMKDFLTYQMMEEFGVAAPLCSYVYLTVNGEDWGLYLAVEGVEEGFLLRNYGKNYGRLYKPDSTDLEGNRGNGKKGGFGMGSSDVKLQYTGDDPSAYSNIFDNAKTDISEADQERLIASLKTLSEGENPESVVDTEAVIRYFVVHNFVVNKDSYTGNMIHNYYLYEENGRLSMIPWDYNLAFGTFQGNTAERAVNDPMDTPVSGSMEDRPMIHWIFEEEEYTARYHQCFEEFLAEFFENGKLMELIDTTAELIAPYVEKDPTKFCTMEEFEKGVATIREFCRLRAESISGQLDGTIPSTTEGQKAEAGTLTDASGITLSDMGTMNMGHGNFGGFGDFGDFPNREWEDFEGFQDREWEGFNGFPNREWGDFGTGNRDREREDNCEENIENSELQNRQSD